MAKRSHHTLIAASIAIAFFGIKPAQAQSKGEGGKEAFYRCKDGQNQTHYGDSVPPACAGFDTEVLNERGMLVRMIEGERTRAARLEREAVESKAKKERDARAQ